MAGDIDPSIAKLVRRAVASSQQREADATAAETLRRAAEREREDLDDKWHADQAILTDLADRAGRSAGPPFARFGYVAEPPTQADSLGSGLFTVECSDGSRAAMRFDARATGQIAIDYDGLDDETLVRTMPLLSASDDFYASAVGAFLTRLRQTRDPRSVSGG